MFIIILECYLSDVILATLITCFGVSNPLDARCASWDYHLVFCFDIRNFVTNN